MMRRVLAFAFVAGCRTGVPAKVEAPQAQPAPATPVATARLVSSSDGEWCQLSPRAFDGDWRSAQPAGRFALAFTGSIARPPWATDLHVIDRSAWRDLHVDIDVRFVAGAEDDLWFGGRDADGARFLRYRSATSTFEELPSLGVPTGGESAWAGESLLVWNGAAGARYVPAEKRWLPISGEGSSRTRGGHPFAVWTGTELVYVDRIDAAKPTMATEAYDPVQDRWRTIRTPFHTRFTRAVADPDGNAWTVAGVKQPQGWQTLSFFRLGPLATAWEEVLPLPGTACDLVASELALHGGKLFLFGQDGRACARDLATGTSVGIGGLGYADAQYVWIGDAMFAMREIWERPADPTGDLFRPSRPLGMAGYLWHPQGTILSPACRHPREAQRTPNGRVTPCPDRILVRGSGGDAERVRRLVLEKARHLESCWRGAHGGSVDAELHIEKSGVAAVKTAGTTALDECVHERLATWRFPHLEGEVRLTARFGCSP